MTTPPPETFGLPENVPRLIAKMRTLALTDPQLFALIHPTITQAPGFGDTK